MTVTKKPRAGARVIVYPFACDKCDLEIDIIKPMAESGREEFCPQCKEQLRRVYSASVMFIGEKVESAEYNPGLGCVVKSKRHRAEVAKKKGLVEIGNEKPETIQKHFDGVRKQKFSKDYEEK